MHFGKLGPFCPICSSFCGFRHEIGPKSRTSPKNDYLESWWPLIVGYLGSIMGYFRVEWPVILGYQKWGSRDITISNAGCSCRQTRIQVLAAGCQQLPFTLVPVGSLYERPEGLEGGAEWLVSAKRRQRPPLCRSSARLPRIRSKEQLLQSPAGW